jgi:hypothetical protein
MWHIGPQAVCDKTHFITSSLKRAYTLCTLPFLIVPMLHTRIRDVIGYACGKVVSYNRQHNRLSAYFLPKKMLAV